MPCAWPFKRLAMLVPATALPAPRFCLGIIWRVAPFTPVRPLSFNQCLVERGTTLAHRGCQNHFWFLALRSFCSFALRCATLFYYFGPPSPDLYILVFAWCGSLVGQYPQGILPEGECERRDPHTIVLYSRMHSRCMQLYRTLPP